MIDQNFRPALGYDLEILVVGRIVSRFHLQSSIVAPEDAMVIEVVNPLAAVSTQALSPFGIRRHQFLHDGADGKLGSRVHISLAQANAGDQREQEHASMRGKVTAAPLQVR